MGYLLPPRLKFPHRNNIMHREDEGRVNGSLKHMKLVFIKATR